MLRVNLLVISLILRFPRCSKVDALNHVASPAFSKQARPQIVTPLSARVDADADSDNPMSARTRGGNATDAGAHPSSPTQSEPGALTPEPATPQQSSQTPPATITDGVSVDGRSNTPAADLRADSSGSAVGSGIAPRQMQEDYQNKMAGAGAQDDGDRNPRDGKVRVQLSRLHG
jgi:hypothetical protein